MKDRVKLDWYGREDYERPRSKRKKDFVREQARYRWYWLRRRGKHDIAHASNEYLAWKYVDWSLIDVPRKGFHARLLGRVARRLRHEQRVEHSWALFTAEKTWNAAQRAKEKGDE